MIEVGGIHVQRKTSPLPQVKYKCQNPINKLFHDQSQHD